jgi:ATP-dependent Clp protease ATP-binding subunit ClpC
MDAKFSQRVNDILAYSREEAIRLGNPFLAPEHLFLGILREGDGLTIDILHNMGVDFENIKAEIESKLHTDKSSKLDDINSLPMLQSTDKIMKLLLLEVNAFNDDFADTEHLMLALLKENNNTVSKVLDSKYNIDYHVFKTEVDLEKTMGSSENPDDDDDDDDEEDGPQKSRAPQSTGKAQASSETPVLDNFGIDLTVAAEEGRLDPIVGRDVEIERVVQILSRRKKNNPVLIGEPGVGKSAIVEGLALRIIQKKVSRVLFDKRIVTLDLASIVAGTKYRGQFEERMKSILNELANTNNVILFIDEIHTIVGAGGASGSLDAANMLKPALARGEIQCIGATTLDEYRMHIEKDGALERRFQKIMVDPTSAGETLEILHNIKERYENHHNVTYTNEALEQCVRLSERYISDRHLPDKAIDALDEAGSRVHISNIQVPKRIEEIEKLLEETKQNKVSAVSSQNFELAASFRDKEQDYMRELENEKRKWMREMSQNRQLVTDKSVEEVIAMMTGIPVTRIAQEEGKRLLLMADQLKKRVIGQSEAINKIVKAIKRNRAGMKDPSKPIGSFIFLGPTGVGKTELAKVLAEYLFDSKDALVRIDMSEYMEKFSVSRLVGAPPGYVGYEEGGQLTEKVRRKPYSVVLLDEIEKAHPDVFNILLQLLDDGQLTDSLGRRVDFKNTIVIMTSNIGSRQIEDFGKGVGFAGAETDKENNKRVIEKALKKAFAPEFLNRIDDVVMFNNLTKEDIHKIIHVELTGLYKRVEEMGYTLELTPAAVDFVAEKGFDIKFGARPLKRAIQKYLEDEMAEAIIEASVVNGDVLLVDLDSAENKIVVKVKPKALQSPGNHQLDAPKNLNINPKNE